MEPYKAGYFDREVCKPFDHKGNDCGKQQNDDHGVLELVKEALEGGLLLLFAELVLAVFGKTLPDLSLAETLLLVGGEVGHNVADFFVVGCQCFFLLESKIFAGGNKK